MKRSKTKSMTVMVRETGLMDKNDLRENLIGHAPLSLFVSGPKVYSKSALRFPSPIPTYEWERRMRWGVRENTLNAFDVDKISQKGFYTLGSCNATQK